MRSPLRWLVAFHLLLLAAPAAAQTARVRVVASDAGGMTLEVTADWPLPLAAAADSAGAGTLTAAAAYGLSGAHLEASHLLRLPALAAPTVSVVSADYDEIERTADAEADVLDRLAGPPVRVERVGLERRRPVATLVARLAVYDPATGAFRRYRRLRVDVRYGAAPPAAARKGAPNPHLAVERSALADGIVFKIPVAREGIYRIDRARLASLVASAGGRIEDVAPSDIRVFGNGGAPLPALNAAPRPADLIQNPVRVEATGERVEGVVFYAAAPSGWRYDEGGARWRHYVNPFDANNYYFLKIGGDGAAPARVAETAFPGWTDVAAAERVEGRHLLPFDVNMWAKESGPGEGMGHTWVGPFVTAGATFGILTAAEAPPGFVPGEVTYRARVAVQANPAATVHYESGGERLASVSPRYVGTLTEDPIAEPGEIAFTHTVTGAAPTLSMRLESRGGEPRAALDWVEVFYPQTLRAADGVVRFATPGDVRGRTAFRLTGFAAAPTVWDVTEPGAVRALAVVARSGGFEVQVDASQGPRELIAFGASGVRALPSEGVRRVEPQNLHGTAGHPDLVVVVPDTFRAAADDFAAYRSGRDGLAVEVVDVEAVFNEFGGGQRDPRAIRDYFKFLYDRAPSEDALLRYALLFGDGHYDYRGLNGDHANRNWIPPFETEETWDTMESYTSDDYFGLLDDDEGEWAYLGSSIPSSERIDLGIGRFTVQTLAEAEAVVAKIRRYEDPATYGSWRTRYTFVADDGYNTFGGDLERDPDLHTQNADVVALEVPLYAPALNVQKIYAISYAREYGTAYRIPGAERDIRAALEQGTLLMNYSGHGGEDALAQEDLLTIDDVRALGNGDRLPVFITATCSFGRWDLAGLQSAAEELLHNPDGGAVALLTTVRTVFTSQSLTLYNVGLNRALNRALLEPDEEGRPRRLGDALRVAKNTAQGAQGNNRKFNLLGDPTMRLGLPERPVEVTRVAGADLTTDTTAALRALERVTLAGEVRAPGGGRDEGFDGLATIVVFDAERDVRLPDYSTILAPPRYAVRSDLIWRGDVPVRAGAFEATFVVPKDISYANAPGRVSVYVQSDATHGSGYTERVRVGGSAPNPLADAEGPSVRLFLNDTTFVSGGMTTPRPTLHVRLDDASGINTVGAGVGHELLLVIDGDEAGAIDIGSFYESEAGSYRRGRVTYPLEAYLSENDLDAFAPGPHTLRLRAWDVANNASEAVLDFYVAADEALTIRNVYSYPNPTAGAAAFLFEHNLPSGTPAEVQLRIYTLSGRPVRTIEPETALPLGALSSALVRIPWDGRDEDGDPLATGVYLYKLRVVAEGSDGERQVREHVEKLAIIR